MWRDAVEASRSLTRRNMESSLDLHRQLLPPGYAAEYRLRCPLPRHRMAVLADLLLTTVVPPAALRGEALVDCKGRDAQPPAAEVPERWRPRGEELFFAAGKLTVGSGEAARLEEFAAAVHSSFLAFEGAHHIRHATETIRSRELPSFVPLPALGRVFPLELTALRAGLELFESRRFSVSLGFTPIVTQSLWIECYDNTLYLTITAEGLRPRSELPLSRSELGERLDAITLGLCGVRWTEDYIARLNS